MEILIPLLSQLSQEGGHWTLTSALVVVIAFFRVMKKAMSALVPAVGRWLVRGMDVAEVVAKDGVTVKVTLIHAGAEDTSDDPTAG